MPDKPSNSDRAFQEIVRVLEDAALAGVDSVELEREDGELIVYYKVGNTGIGAPRFPKELQQEVISRGRNERRRQVGDT